ncbi:MAG: hypothetical protein OEY01_03030 [Desulfobulbaceae bacterium]|nr:hypothetical protein [Desulfobulbaceae bacterium]HIJ78264.1 hypothetical protein [Deltaproteobacteria bacterium]
MAKEVAQGGFGSGHGIRLIDLVIVILMILLGSVSFPSRLLAAPPQAIPQLVVVSPPDMVWVSEKDLFLAGRLIDSEATKVTIKGVGNKNPNGIIEVDSGSFGSLIHLKDGENVIELAAGKLQKSVKVYYLSSKDAAKGGKAPKGFKRFFVHASPASLDCKECHKFRRGKFDYQRIIPVRANCTTGGCHSKMGKAAHVHGPVGAGICISCHSPHGSFEPMAIERTGQELCLVCHQAKREEFKNEVVHAPVEEGCIDCHNPHESAMRFQLRGNGTSVSSLCFTCHEAAIFTKKFRHGPVGAGDCIACHQPHASKNASLLIAPSAKGEVCFQCHKDRQDEFTMKHVHKPVGQDCNLCHDPHSSDTRFQLHKKADALCAGCHKKLSPKVFDDIETAVYKHEPVAQGKCTSCHRPHSSNERSLLAASTEKLCFSCHDELSDNVAGSKFRHGPVQTGDCMACHKVHGSKNSRILVRYFPEEFYKDYDSDNYDLCFGCHNKDIAKKKFTKTLTNFRDGEYNLHFFHVNRKKGRNCVACHDPHASNQAKHIRYDVPFGAWSYPISITKTTTGGTCVVGCHAPKSYDRSSPKIKPSR